MLLDFVPREHPSRRAAELLREATARLGEAPHLSTAHLHCSLHGGVLVLQGRVASYFQKQIAQEVVKHLDGAMQILNQIEVVG
jgi:osmotically-inducible protein OsmY